MLIGHSSGYALEVVGTSNERLTTLVRNQQISVDYKSDGTPVTNGDLAVDRTFQLSYQGMPDVVVFSEERSIDPNTHALVQLDLDPLDGTRNFADAYIEWLNTPESERLPLPISAGAISLAATMSGEEYPTWGILDLPFTIGGTVTYLAERGQRPIRTDSAGSTRLKPIGVDHSRRSAVIMSPRMAKRHGDKLNAVGFDIVIQDAAAANIASVFDPDLIHRLQPGAVGEDQQIVATLSNGHTWDVAAGIAIARGLESAPTTLDGKPRTTAPGERGAVFALDDITRNSILGAIATE